MFYLRCVKTKSNSTAVQVVKYINRNRVIAKHIGSAKNLDELNLLKVAGQDWIDKQLQQSLFSLPKTELKKSVEKSLSKNNKSSVLITNKIKLLSTHSRFIYEVLNQILKLMGFTKLIANHPQRRLLLDLVVMRLIKPSSKLESMQYLSAEFDISYDKSSCYRNLAKFVNLKDEIEKIVVKFAKKRLDFKFRYVFYDVSTLYFESFKSDDELRQCGFSKDNKFNQPQVVIGLLVNSEGFPISYQLFAGNKFEGHTFIPVLEELKQKHKLGKLTVVADAAMISQKNVDELLDKKINYIVGARLANLNKKFNQQINSKLEKVDGSTIRIPTDKGNLICHFSNKRYSKDKHECKKQVYKAFKALNNPTKAVKRLKYISSKNKESIHFNQKLLDRNKALWGVKGYYSNLSLVSNQEIIHQYGQLWKVEKAFRITKSDLRARPIYHRNTNTIQAHILICFMALAVAKYIEIKSGLSLKKSLALLATVKDARILNQLNGDIICMRSDLSKNVENLLIKLEVSH